MKLSKRYRILESFDKIYLDISLPELRNRLNLLFKKPIAEDGLTGIHGKYLKKRGLYRVKYIYSRNAQLQPKMYERYYILAEAGEDAGGTFLEYKFVYDRLYEPLVKCSYLLTAALLIACMLYLTEKGTLEKASGYVLSAVAAATALITLRKPRVDVEECKKSAEIFKKTVLSLQ